MNWTGILSTYLVPRPRRETFIRKQIKEAGLFGIPQLWHRLKSYAI